jgi:hypothetical protein
MDISNGKRWGAYVRLHIDLKFAGSVEDAAKASTIPPDRLRRIADGEGPSEHRDQLRSIGIDPGVYDIFTKDADGGSHGCQYNIIGELAEA